MFKLRILEAIDIYLFKVNHKFINEEISFKPENQDDCLKNIEKVIGFIKEKNNDACVVKANGKCYLKRKSCVNSELK